MTTSEVHHSEYVNLFDNIFIDYNNEGAARLSAFVKELDEGDVFVWLETVVYYFFEDETLDDLKHYFAQRVFDNGWIFAETTED